MEEIKGKGKSSQKFCCFNNHDKENKGSPLGHFPITVSGEQKSVLELLGPETDCPATDHELQEKMKRFHSYVFNMGAGQYFTNYEEAEDELLKRNFPKIANDDQDIPIFVPETFLPKVPRAVDPVKYETKKKSLDDESRKFLGIKVGTEESQNLSGDITEKELSDALKDFYSTWPDKEVTVFQGAVFKPPGTKKGGNQEHDFLIVSKILKCIICIESKKSLYGKSVHGGIKQLRGMEKIIEQYFGPMSGWTYIAWMHFRVNNSGLCICKDCDSNIIFTKEDLHTKLSELYDMKEPAPNHDEYKTVVKRIAFSLLSQDIGTPCTITSMVDNKVVGGKGAKQGQGDFLSFSFWTLDQSNIMLVYHRFVLLNSAWSTGKTLCMREKAKKSAAEIPEQKVFFIVCRYFYEEKTLLEIQIEKQLKNMNNINVTSITLNYDATNLGSSMLSLAESHPGAAFFIDEAVLPGDKLSSLAEELSQVVTTLTIGGGMLWMSVAGYYGDNTPTLSDIESTFSMFHVPVMTIPLRSTREVLAMAGMEGETISKVLGVAGVKTIGTSYTIPAMLLRGLPGIIMRVQDRNNKEEVVTAVRFAREKISERTGARGVPVLCNYPTEDLFSTVREGLLSAKEGGTMNNAEKVITYTWLPIPGKVGEEEVAAWLAGHDKGEEERDLLTDKHCSRGWEAMAVMVVDMRDEGGQENLVMRGRTCVALVTHKRI